MTSSRLFRVRQSVSLALAALVLAAIATPVDARTRHHNRHHVSTSKVDSDATGIETSGRYADFVIDARTGRVLHAKNADALRHPASLTKMMTLYIMFEELERGRFNMASPLKVSEHAAAQSPTKLNLRPGQEIAVGDAIRGLVTQSANDAAVTIAENIGGSESAFAQRMTQTARRLGMTNTLFRNASGLPNDEQVTTARDMVTLGRALQERFPEQYKVFQTRSFAYRGRVYGNHNHLLGQVEGVDGIKTGYTQASGFNLVTSIRRDGRFMVAAVLGGTSGGARDAQMRRLLQTYLADASTGSQVASVLNEQRTGARDSDDRPVSPAVMSSRVDTPAPSINRNRGTEAPQTPVVLAAAIDLAPQKPVRPHLANASEQTVNQPAIVQVKTIPVRTTVDRGPSKPEDHSAEIAKAKMLLAEQLRKQQVASNDHFIPEAPLARPPAVAAKADSDPHLMRSGADKQAPARLANDRGRPEPEKAKPERLMTASVDIGKPQDKPQDKRTVETAKAPIPAMPTVREGWLIQVAAVDNANDAKAILSKAKSAAGDKLAASTAVTETVAKGNSTLYRARFSGFSDQKSANAACASLKRKDFACLVVHQ